METTQEESYSVTIKGKGLSLDQGVSRDVALRIVNLVLAGSAAPPTELSTGATHGHAGSADSSAEGVSIGEFIEQVGAKRNPDKITAMGVFLKDNGQDRFTSEELRPLFQEAGEKTPGNFSRDVRWAQTAKWIAPAAGDPNSLYVTRKGEKAVRDGFPDEVRRATSQPAGRKRPRKKKATSEN